MHAKNPSTRFAKVLSVVALAAAIALPVVATAIWVFWNQLAELAAASYRYAYNVKGLGVGARAAGFGLYLTSALIQAYGLLGVRQTFQEAAAGRALSARAIAGFRRFAWVSFVMVFVKIIKHMGLILILSLSDPSTEGAIAIQFGTDELKALFFALLLVFVAQVFLEAKRAKDENETFV